MRRRELASATLRILVQAALLCWIFMAPFAWILRDGLGPDAVDSRGWEAFRRWFTCMGWGPMLLGLLLANWLCRSRAARPETKWPILWVVIWWALVLAGAGALFFEHFAHPRP